MSFLDKIKEHQLLLFLFNNNDDDNDNDDDKDNNDKNDKTVYEEYNCSILRFC